MRVVSPQEEFQWLLLVGLGVLLSLLPEFFLWRTCLLLVVLVGVPHGALDGYLLAIEAKKSWKKFSLSIAQYIFLVVCSLFIWRVFPHLFWAAFFAAAAYHFGMSDEHPEVLRAISTQALYRTLWILSRGFLLVFAPIACHPQKIAGYISQAATPQFATQVTHVAPFFCIYAAVIFLWTTFQSWRRASLQTYRWILVKHLVALAVFLLLFAVADPLVSFTLYFCCHHSLNHTFRVLGKVQWTKKKGTIGVWAFTLTVLAILFFQWVRKYVVDVQLPIGWVSASFVTIAALTFPHLIVVRDLHQQLKQRFRTR